MRLAWFRTTTFATGGGETSAVSPRDGGLADPWDDTRLLIHALEQNGHRITLVDVSRAHDFVWRHARHPFDLCVYELGGTPAHQFIAAYATHYPGIVLLRGVPCHDHALRASRIVVVPHEPVAQAVADDYPGTRVRTLTPGVEPLPDDAPPVVESLRWPPDGAALSYAMAGLAAGRAVIVFDSAETADWPSLDPQNWRLRAPWSADPICVSVDPRDEAHSLRLARRRLADDSALRARLGAAGRVWWRAHATVAASVAGFESLLAEAAALPDPIGLEVADGTGKARAILNELGLDFSALDLGPRT